MIRQALTLLATALLLGIALAALLVWFIAPRAHAQARPYQVFKTPYGCLYIAGNAQSTAMLHIEDKGLMGFDCAGTRWSQRKPLGDTADAAKP